MDRKIIAGIISGIILWAGFIFAVEISVNPATESLQSGNVFVITLGNLKPGDHAVKVFNNKGKYVRTILDKCSTETTIVVPWNLRGQWGKKVKPGQYTLKYLSGITFTLDKSFGKDGIISDTGIISPTDVQTDRSGNLYVLDEGASILYKFTADGKPLKDINGKNFIESTTAPLWGSFCIGNDGRIYLSFTHSTSHVIGVYDGKTGALLYYIGGAGNPYWNGPYKPGDGCYYPVWVGINGSHLYAGSYVILCWDVRKPGNTGGLWGIKQKDQPLTADAITTDGKNAIYWAPGSPWSYTGLHKIIDETTYKNGKVIYKTPEGYLISNYSLNSFTDPITKMQINLNDIRGLASDHEDGVYAVQRKYSRIVKFSDTGFGFDYVASFGSFGKNASNLEFTAPHDVAISPNGHYIYVVEDGEAISKENTTPGLARIMKFKISYKEEKEIKLIVTP
jgi:DNA-binding beta-propeller fold protein YncE